MGTEENDLEKGKKRKFTWKSFALTMKNAVVAILRGDLILRLRADKLFPFILWTFLLAWLSIWLSFKAECTMLKVEKNMKTIDTLKIYKAQRTSELVSLDRIGKLEEMLKANNSKVTIPENPADKLE